MLPYATPVRKTATIVTYDLNTITGNIIKRRKGISALTPDLTPEMLKTTLPVEITNFQRDLADLLSRAIQAGIVIKIDTVPLPDLAMGSYTMEAEIYPAREYVSMNYEEMNKRKNLPAVPVPAAPITITLEKAAYDRFCTSWNLGAFGNFRYGQAFYNHFKLYKLRDQEFLADLTEADGEKAKALIARLFNFS